MLFNSLNFIFLFLPIALFVFYGLKRRSISWAIIWLGVCSIFIYGYWSLESLPILAVSIILNYLVGQYLSNQAKKWRYGILLTAIGINLLLLGYFKYVNFFIDNINVAGNLLSLQKIEMLEIALPIGISFFTFTQIAFLVDAYNEQVAEKNFINYMLFVTFFPHIIAGPILHHKQMMPQFLQNNGLNETVRKFGLGIFIFTIGLSKKVLIADPIGQYAESFFSHFDNGLGSIPTMGNAWMGSFCYTFQLYFDFSGYSDMAIGISLLFGILLPINFDSPFRATSLINFWQRWHISLTKFIWEYVYTPLSLKMVRRSIFMNKKMQFLYSLLLPTLLALLISGFWHGAKWTYVAWGLMHGVLLVINHIWRRRSFFKFKQLTGIKFISTFVSWMVTFITVNITMVMFRAPSVHDAMDIYKGMFWAEPSMPTSNYFDGQSLSKGWLYLLVSLGLVLLFPSSATFIKSSDSVSTWARRLLTSRIFAVVLAILFCFSILRINQNSPFLYYQF